MSPRLLALLIISLLFGGTSIARVTIHDDRPQPQQWEGWGVSLCWWASMCGRESEEHLDSLVTWLTSPDELNYNIFRYNIGGGDDPQWRNCEKHHCGKGKGLRAEMEGFMDSATDTMHWERDAAQQRITSMIHRSRPDAIFEAFSNSAPWWMTVSGCAAGHDNALTDNLREDCYEVFARYLIDVCRYFERHHGITFRTLEPFNEGMTDYWYRSGSQEGCHFSSEAQVAFLKVLYPMMRGQGMKTVIAASDETNIATAADNFEYYQQHDALRYIGQWNTHTYQGDNADRMRMHRLAAEAGVKLWQSETGDGGRGLHGNLMMAQRLIDDIRYLRPSAWLDWQYVEENYDQWSLVMCDSQWRTYRRHKNFFVRKQFSRFIPAGYRWVDIDAGNALAAVSPDGKSMTVVMLNTSDKAMTMRLKAASGRKWKMKAAYRTSRTESCSPVNIKSPKKVLLPPLSVTTAVWWL